MDTLVTTLYSSPVRDALGQRTQYTHPNGMRTKYDYDSWNRLEGIYHKNASTDVVLDSFAYTLNDGNEITRIDNADGSNWRYTYDNRGRLDAAFWYSSGDSIADYYDYTFDDGDNMTQYWHWDTQTVDVWDYVYNAANQQTSMTLNEGTAETRTYDDWGRLTARAQGSYSAAYSYRYGDRLRQVTSSFPGEVAVSPVYEYGGDGKMRRRGAEELKYGLGFNPVAERTNLLQIKTFVYEPHKAVSERLAYIGVGFDLTQHYYNHDHLGSVRRTRSSAKGSLGVWNYEPFGKVHSGSAPFIFALHPYESGMGFHRAPYRNYSPAMARWTTRDPLGMIDGPNMYGYVGGMPIIAIDLYGQSWASVGRCFFTGAITGAIGSLAVGGAAVGAIWFGAPVAVVTAGLGGVAIAGAILTGVVVGRDFRRHNWDGLAHTAGALLGGFTAGRGAASFVRNGIKPGGKPFRWNDWDQHYNPNLGGLTDWLATGPTPGSAMGSMGMGGAGIATITSGGC